MKQSKFIEILKKRRIEYEVKGDIISVLSSAHGYVDLNSLTSLPKYAQFNNIGGVNLSSLKSIPESTQFNNGGHVYLRSLESLPERTQFNNGGGIYLHMLKSIPESTQFNNGSNVYLRSLESLPENVHFNNGGTVYLNNKKLVPEKSYIERNDIEVKNNKVILYKRVSKDFLTQEGSRWETLWRIGRTVTHPNWNPGKEECGPGKFHACAKPFWCDWFRHNKNDIYIAIEVNVKDLHEWKKDQTFPQKIAFRCGKVLYECDRYGTKV